MSVVTVAWRMVRQNLWLYLLLYLVPLVLALATRFSEGKVTGEDAAALLQQDVIYGMSLVVLQSSTLLSQEQRSRRIVQVLATRMSRAKYLGALLVAAWAPQLGFVLISVAGGLLVGGLDAAMLARFAFTLALNGLWVGTVGILASVLLPGVAATLATGLLTAIVMYAGIPPAALLHQLTLAQPGHIAPVDVLASFMESAAWFALACVTFARRDLQLKMG